MTRFTTQTASAKMPASCFGRYGRVAVIEIEDGLPADFQPAMISERARGVVRIVQTWEKCNIGKTDRCAFARARARAEALANKLNVSTA